MQAQGSGAGIKICPKISGNGWSQNFIRFRFGVGMAIIETVQKATFWRKMFVDEFIPLIDVFAVRRVEGAEIVSKEHDSQNEHAVQRTL